MGLKLEKDKAKHMAGSFFLTVAGFLAIGKVWWTVLIVAVIGILKEIYDIYHGVASWQDLAVNVLGICFALLVIFILIDIRKGKDG